MSSFSVNVHMPKDRVTQTHQGYGFVEFMGEEDADYAIKVSFVGFISLPTRYLLLPSLSYKLTADVPALPHDRASSTALSLSLRYL